MPQDEFNMHDALSWVFGKPEVLADGEILAYNLKPAPRFALGQCQATMGAMGALEDNGTFPIVYLKRHEAGDWGELSEHDKAANEAAIHPDPEKCSRILSHYRLADGQRIWVITEWDRSRTTILLPDEY